MGINNSKPLDRNDETLLNQMSQGMDTLRRSMDSFPDGTKKFKMMLESNETKVHDVLRRSRKGSTRVKALSVLRDIEDLKDKERSSVRDSILDNGAVESSSIIAADVKKYDRNRQRDKSVEELSDIRKRLERLRGKIYGAETIEEAVESRKQIEELMVRLERLSVQPKSKLEEYKIEYRNVLKHYVKKLTEKQIPHDPDGAVMSKLQDAVTMSPPQIDRQRGAEQRQHLNAQDEIAVIQGKVLSLQDECGKFAGIKDSSEYNELFQSLMKLWDQLGKINDEKLNDQRDSIIGLISITLKGLNRKCVENSRSSLSKNKILSLVEMFQMQYQKIVTYLSNGQIKETDQVYHILNDIQNGLHTILFKNECRLVTTKLTPSLTNKPLPIYLSRERLVETNFDAVYIDDDSNFQGFHAAATGGGRNLKSNKSCPNLSKLDRTQHQNYQQVRATCIPIKDQIVVVEKPPTFQPRIEHVQMAPKGNHTTEMDQFLDNLNYESITLKYAVEAFETNDKEKYNELDERLIDMLIQIESLKGRCIGAEQEHARDSIMQRAKATCVKLKNKCNTNSVDTVRREDEIVEQQMITIENIMEHLEILKTQINESYAWDVENPEFKVLDGALKSALMQLDLIEPKGYQREIAKTNAISEVRAAINRLDAQKFKTTMAGTEV